MPTVDKFTLLVPDIIYYTCLSSQLLYTNRKLKFQALALHQSNDKARCQVKQLIEFHKLAEQAIINFFPQSGLVAKWSDFDNLRVRKISTSKRSQVKIIHVSQTFGKNLLVVASSCYSKKLLLTNLCKGTKKFTSSPDSDNKEPHVKLKDIVNVLS